MSIYSSIEFDTKLTNAIEQIQINNKVFAEGYSWTPFIFLMIFFVIIIFGLTMIFTYYQKIQNLYRLQENFISNFTHELKTPVASIKLYLETMKKRDVDREKAIEFIDFMLRDTERLHTNIEQILQTSKVESQNEAFSLEDTEVNQFIKDFLEKVQHLFNGKIKFEGAEQGQLYTRLNKELMESALLNLISNGMKYNDSDTPQVSITVKSNYSSLTIFVLDNGRGIEEKYQKKIFKKFYRVDKTKKGTGLGLYLVEQIISFHKGKIAINSDSDGTEFSIELPRFFPANIPQFSRSERGSK